ncbi:MAG: hypothetical protein IKK26_05280, partial [Clostridia bacterium]|nr:hypothetical protein [Clostridia bacterium]
MARFKNALITKFAVVMLSFAMILGMMPAGIITAIEVDDSTAYGTLSVISPNGSVTDADGKNAVATFDDVTLDWSPADPSIGRTVDGWWVGVKVTAPSHLKTEEDFAKVTYQRCKSAAAGTWNDAVSFWDTKESADTATEHYITLWVLVNEQYLNDAILKNKTVNYTWRFDWDGDDEAVYEQTVAIKIKPENIKLVKDDAQMYPSSNGIGSVGSYDDALTVQSEGNYVKYAYTEDTVLDWVEKNPEIGRMQDGWWAGLKVSAPAELKTESDFEGVTYQSLSGDSWSEPKRFWQYKDSGNSDTQHFIGVWGLLNVDYLKKATNPFKYVWRFDWDKDNVYEQTVIIEIDPSYIKLNNAEGAQVYPELGVVAPITGGEVSGNQTGNVVVDATGITLDWSPKDESIGRMEDGWWAGVLITAPEGTVIADEDKNDVKFQIKVGDADWSEEKSFYKYQDSAKDGAVHYMQMWTVLNRELIENNDKVTAQWRFDWDKDGEYEQTVTLNVDSKTVTLKRLDRTDFVFEETAEDKEVWVGNGTYQNTAGSLSAPGKVTYAIDEASTADATIDPETGIVTLKGIGRVKINATIAEDDVYNSKTISYSFNVVKIQPEGLNFEYEEPADIVYSENGIFKNVATDAYSTGEVTYTIIKHESLDGDELNADLDPVAVIAADGTITVKRSGKITVKAVLAEDGKYFGDEATYTITVKKAEQKDFNFAIGTPSELTYRTTPYDNITFVGNLVPNENVTYSIVDTEDGDVAEIVDGNKIRTLKKGTFKLLITSEGNDCYESNTKERIITVGVAAQTTFAFTYAEPDNVVYNENGNKFENIAIDGESEGEVTYEVVVGNDVADFEDAENPAVLTIKKAGTVIVEATKAGDDKYDKKTISYTLNVDRAKQAFTFADGEEVTRYYGIKTYNNTVVPTEDATKADGVGYGNGLITYSLEANDIGAVIDPVTGEISFEDSEAKIGTLKVNVTKAADERYDECSGSYTLEIKY